MYRLLWDDVDCYHKLKGCRCGATLLWPDSPELGSIRIEAQMHGRYLSYKEKLFEMMKQIMRAYTLENGVLQRAHNQVCNDEAIYAAACEFYSTDANRLIAPPFYRSNMPSFVNPVTNVNLRPIVKRLEVQYFRRIGLDVRTMPRERDGVKTLTYLCYRALSWDYICFEDFDGYKAMVNTADNMSVEKVVHLFSEFAGPGISRDKQKQLEWWMPQALSMLERALEVDKHRGIVNFRYHPSMLSSFVSSTLSASGIRAGMDSVDEFSDVKIKHTVSGKKIDQFPYYASRFHTGMQRLYVHGIDDEEVQQLLEVYCYIALKQEVKFVWPASKEACQKLKMKCREFFIPNMIQQFLSKLLMTPRQKLERGDWIRIGQKWNYGGAQEFAKFLNAFSDDMVWHFGDFSKLDKSIKDYLLSFYVSSGQAYFRTDVNGKQFLEHLFVLLCERICVKIVNHVMGAWSLMLSFMYSGGFETSHGDSWCVLLVWFLYICYSLEKYPQYASDIMSCLFVAIVIVVYGDDHVWCTPRKLAHVLNETLFAAFVQEFFDMVIRDAVMTDRFFSEVNAAGEVTTAGVTFLKRYFVLDTSWPDGYPVVFPFKPTHETMLKLFASKDGLDVTYVLQAVGQAYDTLGTNVVAYRLCYEFYEYYMKLMPPGKTMSDIVSSFFESGDVARGRRMLKKSGISRAELEDGFPSLDRLKEMHLIDVEKCSNKIPYKSDAQIYGQDGDEVDWDYIVL